MAHAATLLLASSWLLVVLTAGETSLDPSTLPAGTPVRVQVLSDGEDHRLEIEGVIGPIPITGGAVTEFSLPRFSRISTGFAAMGSDMPVPGG